MAIKLDHTIIYAADREKAARFLAEILGLPEPEPVGPFLQLRTANGVCLDYMSKQDGVAHQHYAFRISDADFDAIFARVRQREITYWADPMCAREGQLNDYYGGRGFYFRDPSGHLMEVLTGGPD